MSPHRLAKLLAFVAAHVAALVVFLTLAASPSPACGPYPFDTRFVFDHRPGVAEHRAVRGELGIFGPQYDTPWIFAAWRQLADLGGRPGLVEADREKLVWLLMPDASTWGAGDDEASANNTSAEPDPVRAWSEAREELTGEGVGWIDTTRTKVEGDGATRTWSWFENCLPDAFRTAAETLRARVAAHGADDPAVREWLRGQDAVFENCDGGQVEPEEASPDWPAWLRHDRAYQRAAAALYSERYEPAAERFAAISEDALSPWRTVSGYLVGRALARAGRYDEALARYRRVLENPDAAAYHASARGLIDHLLARTDPDALRREVVARLSASPLPDSLEQDLVDFRRLAGEVAYEGGAIDPLTDWFRAVRGWTAPAEVVERWRTERAGPSGPAWRWAALLRANATEIVFDDGREYPPLAPEVLDELLAAPTFEPGATGAVSEAYHRARLLLDVGRADEAVPILEGALQGEFGSVAVAETNHVRIQRLRAAATMEEIVRFGQMFPVEVGWNYDDSSPLATPMEAIPTWTGGPLWHYVSARLLNGLAPSALAQGIDAESVPDDLLRAESLRTAWTRAVVLGDDAGVVALARRLAEVDGDLAPHLAPLAGASASERPFRAALVILRHPGLHPDFHYGVARPTAVDEIDPLYTDWWCPGDSFLLPEPAELAAVGADTPENLEALRRLAETPAAPDWLGPVVLRHADAYPDDPDVPEALHRLVRATRHGCHWGPEGFGEVSRGAFQRLHGRYPDNPWTEKTPYWFD